MEMNFSALVTRGPSLAFCFSFSGIFIFSTGLWSEGNLKDDVLLDKTSIMSTITKIAYVYSMALIGFQWREKGEIH